MEKLISIRQLIREGALFVSNHSGGKDSQVMHHRLAKIIPPEQLIVVHAHLPEVEWEGTIEHIKNTIGSTPLHVCQAKKTFFEMVEHRKMFPSPKNRQCTSDLKRNPIHSAVVGICNERGFKTVVNCMGLRADESSGRKKKPVFKRNDSYSNGKRTWYEWLPIHSLTTKEVFAYIAGTGHKPFWTYGEGMKRKSCSFCIMACESDLKIAARLRPALLEKYDEVENRIGQTMMMPSAKKGRRFLKQIVTDTII